MPTVKSLQLVPEIDDNEQQWQKHTINTRLSRQELCRRFGVERFLQLKGKKFQVLDYPGNNTILTGTITTPRERELYVRWDEKQKRGNSITYNSAIYRNLQPEKST